MRVKIEVEVDNAAFKGWGEREMPPGEIFFQELTVVVNNAVLKLRRAHSVGGMLVGVAEMLQDSNGNTVGRVKVEGRW